jgi:hypothetical protein
MAAKKTATLKAGTMSKPTTNPKAAPQPAAPAKSPRAMDAKSKPTAAKKAPAVKLTDAQGRVLTAVHQTKEAGYLGNKAQAKTLEALLHRKLIKRGKKENGFYRYSVTKAGEKHMPAASAPAASAPAASAPASAPEASAVPSPAAPV